MGAGGVLQGAGMFLSLIAQHEEAAANQREALFNERLARRAAGGARARGRMEAAGVRMEGSRIISEQKVAFAASGVDPSVGTPLQVMADTRMMSELDALTVENNATREAFGYTTQAEQIRRQAEYDREASTRRMVATVLGGSGSLFASGARANASNTGLARYRNKTFGGGR